MLSASIAASSTGFTCPSYGRLRQPSVSSARFSIGEYAGLWYLLATTEPTLPTFCKCGMNNVSLHFSSGEYTYTSTNICGKSLPISVRIKGKLSDDPSSPGLLHEQAAIFNHTMAPLDPYFIFRVGRSSSGSLETIFSYACLGRIPPVFGSEAFSFNVLGRSRNVSAEAIEAMVAAPTRAWRRQAFASISATCE